MKKLLPLVVAAVLAAFVPGIPVHAGGTMPAAGQAAPAFTLPSQNGTPISLDQYRGKWVVLYFYPRDMTTGCTIEAHNFQNALPQFDAKNAVILGVSVDSTGSHQQFCAKDGLTFHLLSDTSHNVVDSYGSLIDHNGVAMASRNTFLINPQGKIAQVWTQVNPQTAASDVLAAIPSSATPAMGGSAVPRTQSLKPPQAPQ